MKYPQRRHLVSLDYHPTFDNKIERNLLNTFLIKTNQKYMELANADYDRRGEWKEIAGLVDLIEEAVYGSDDGERSNE